MSATSHARLSASSADRFMECPGSVKLSELLRALGIVEEESEYAAEGTAAHALGEKCLRAGTDAWMYIGQLMYTDDSGEEWFATAEMAEYVQEYVNYAREVGEEGEMIIEERLEIPDLTDAGGTADLVVDGITEKNGGFLRIGDLKYGFMPVEVEGNRQMMYYAFLVLLLHEITPYDEINVCLAIIQPRCLHGDGSIREHWMSSRKILDWGYNELIPAMRRVDTSDTPLKQGSHCRYCPAKIACKNLKMDFSSFVEGAKQMQETDDLIETLSNDALAIEYEKIQTVDFYIKALKAEAKRRAMACNPLAGTKMIYGKSTRKWKDGVDDKIAAKFGDKALTEPAMKSPAQIEKLPGGKAFAGEYAYKDKGKPRLVGADETGEVYDPSREGEGFKGVPQ